MNYDYSSLPLYKENKYLENFVDKFEPIVSIITPFYNSGEFIEDTANCVLNQSFPWFEWIIIDDGSHDKKSLEILSNLEKKDKRIRVFHKKNEGLAATRDYGAKHSNEKSQFLLFLDDDDLIETNYVECTLYSLITNPNAAFAYTNTVGFGEMEYLWNVKFDIKREVKENILVATALIRKKDFFEVGGYGLTEKGINEDWIFWLKLFSKSKIPLKVNYYGFWYRRKKNGELKKSLENQEITDRLLKPYVKKIDYRLTAIEYPKDNYDWNDVFIAENLFKIPSKITSKKINIIMILPHIVTGGADKFDIDFLKGLDKRYSVTVVLTNISDNEWLNELRKYVDSYYILPSFLDRKYWHLFIEYLIRKNDVKLIFNTNSIYGYMVLPYLKSVFNGIKIIDYVHMEEWYNRNGGYSRDSSSISSVIDKTLVCNNSSRNVLIDYFNRNPSEIETVYIGVDEDIFNNQYSEDDIINIKNKYNIPLTKHIISFIARIAVQKRPFLLFEIIKKYLKSNNDAVFVICGDGPMLGDLKRKIFDEKLSNYVFFLGNISNTKELYAISDCTLNCSIKEGLALTSYESLSMGIPIVSSNVGGQSEIIDESVGILINTSQKESDALEFNYDIKEIDEYVDALKKILNNKKKYKQNCRKKILNGFTIKQMHDKMNSIISELISTDTKKKNENTDVAKSLLDQYLLESKKEYDDCIFLNNYNNNNYFKKFRHYIDIMGKIFTRLHIYNEMKLMYKLILSILSIPIYISKLFLLIIKRIVNLFFKNKKI